MSEESIYLLKFSECINSSDIKFIPPINDLTISINGSSDNTRV